MQCLKKPCPKPFSLFADKRFYLNTIFREKFYEIIQAQTRKTIIFTKNKIWGVKELLNRGLT